MSSRSIDIQCWHCGVTLAGVLLPLSRFEECSSCNSDLHTCRACKFYSATLTSTCNEDRADFVLEKEKANFCDFFTPNPSPFNELGKTKQEDARAKLAELFGETEENAGEPSPTAKPLSEADKALAELKRLFGDD